MGRIIGIDLGTTNSLAAYWQDGAVHLIPNAFGEYLTPSVVSVDETGTVFVGKVAKERLISHPEQTVSVFKRSMGTEKTWQLGGKWYRPEELSALVLRRLKEDAEAYFGEPIEEAVVSVPAYFGDLARKATRDAGELAGLKVERILNEPSAAALAYLQMAPAEERHIMVFDFGGGTLDVSLVKCFENVVQIEAVSGDNRLGGSDFDRAIAWEFCKRNGWDYANLEPSLRQNLLRSAENAKQALTGAEYTMMVVTDEEKQLSMSMSRKELITIIGPALQRLGKPIQAVLHDGRISASELDGVVMVGGSSKMPVVQQYLKFILKKAKLTVSDPDHMIALGVGIYAGIKERQNDIGDLIMTDLCPFSLGVDVRNEAEPEKELMSVIIPRNNMLPVSREQTYVTASNGQRVMEVNIFQGEEMYVKDNTKLGTIRLNVPSGPAGQEKARVRFTYDINGLLVVRCQVISTGLTREMTLFNGKETKDRDVLKRAKELANLTMSAQNDEENRLLIERGQRIFSQVSKSYKNMVEQCVSSFGRAVTMGDQYEIARMRKTLTALLDKLEAEFIDSEVEEGTVDEFQSWLENMESGEDFWDDQENEEADEEKTNPWDWED